jgi:hypothetical protein
MMGLICCPKTSVTNYHSTLCNIPEEQRPDKKLIITANLLEGGCSSLVYFAVYVSVNMESGASSCPAV